MGVVIEALTEKEVAFIATQKVFFVGTAPLSKDHHVNVSPKSPGTSVIVIDPHTVAYFDLTGSGAETAAHVMENERMTLLFCNLESGAPKILRLYGNARMVLKKDVEPSLLQNFPESVTSSFGFRAIYILDIHRISSSCGYSLPVMNFEKYRKTLEEYTVKEGLQGMADYRIKKNSFSIDGLCSLAQFENNDLTILPKPESGYIHGEVVKDGTGSVSSGPVNHYQPRKRGRRQDDLQTKAMGIGVFLLGIGVGVGFMAMNPSFGTRSSAK
jgi:hypothetical protein